MVIKPLRGLFGNPPVTPEAMAAQAAETAELPAAAFSFAAFAAPAGAPGDRPPALTMEPSDEEPVLEEPTFAVLAPSDEAPPPAMPAFEAPIPAMPAFETPPAEMPAFETPPTEMPAFETPAPEMPAFEEAPAEMPAFEARAPETPPVDEPAAERRVQEAGSGPGAGDAGEGPGGGGGGGGGEGGPGEGGEGAGGAAGGGGGMKGFLASRRNRIITIVVAVIALLGLICVVGVLVLTVFSGPVRTPAPPVTGGQSGVGGSTAATSGAGTTTKPTGGATTTKPATTTPAPQVSLQIPPSFEVFTENKDPFKPGLVPTEGGPGTAEGGGEATQVETGTTTTESSETIRPGKDVLYLAEITEDEDGERTATVYWSNVAYDVVEGDRVDDSPWEVVSIGSSSATFLYGDDRITLRVGEQLGK